MKKIFVLILCMLLTSCSNNNNVTKDSLNVKTNKKNREEEFTLNHSSRESTYENQKLGYKITFPENWNGWYLIDNPEKMTIRIKFYGRSKTGTISAIKYFGEGLPLFYIVDEINLKQNTWDNIISLGTANRKEYYLVTSTGSDIGVLQSIQDEKSAVRQIVDYRVDEEELSLAQQDWIKASEMLNDIDSISKSFTALNN